MNCSFLSSEGSTKYIFMLLMTFSTAIFAARPYHTDDPGTTEQGKYEFELSNDFWKNASTPGIVFKHGLTDRAELDIPVNYVAMPEDKRVVVPAMLYFKFSLIPNTFAATFTEALGEPLYSANLIFAKSINFITLTANCGSAMTGNKNDIDLTYNTSEILRFGQFETGAELGGTQEGLNWWQVGARFFFKEWFSLDAGLCGDFDKSMNMNVTTGLWFAFPIAKEKKGD